MSYDPDPARRRRRRYRVPRLRRASRRRRYDPAPIRRRVRRGLGGLKPFLAGLGGARVGEKVMDFVGLQSFNPVVKPVSAYLGGKWKGLLAELVYELVDERTDDVWGWIGIKGPIITMPTLGTSKPLVIGV
jgi:hypothetical protein